MSRRNGRKKDRVRTYGQRHGVGQMSCSLPDVRRTTKYGTRVQGPMNRVERSACIHPSRIWIPMMHERNQETRCASGLAVRLSGFNLARALGRETCYILTFDRYKGVSLGRQSLCHGDGIEEFEHSDEIASRHSWPKIVRERDSRRR